MCLSYLILHGSEKTNKNVMARIPTSIFRHLFPHIDDLNDVEVTTFAILHLINKNIDSSFDGWLFKLLDIPSTSWTMLLRQYVATEVSMSHGSENKLHIATTRAENVPDNVIPEWIKEYMISETSVLPSPSTGAAVTVIDTRIDTRHP